MYNQRGSSSVGNILRFSSQDRGNNGQMNNSRYDRDRDQGHGRQNHNQYMTSPNNHRSNSSYPSQSQYNYPQGNPNTGISNVHTNTNQLPQKSHFTPPATNSFSVVPPPYQHGGDNYNSSKLEDRKGVPRVSVYESFRTPGLLGSPPQPIPVRQESVVPTRHHDITPGHQHPHFMQNNLKSNQSYQQQGLPQPQPQPYSTISTSRVPTTTRESYPNTPASMVSRMSPDELLQKFRSLECSGCSRHFGYQSRTNKNIVYCTATCLDDHSGCVPTPVGGNGTNGSDLQHRGGPGLIMNEHSGYVPTPVGGNGRELKRRGGPGLNMDEHSGFVPTPVGGNGTELNRRGRPGLNMNEQSGFVPTPAGGNGPDLKRRGGPGPGLNNGRKVDKNPFGIGDDDSEWVNKDVVDRKAYVSKTNLAPVSTTRTKAKSPVGPRISPANVITPPAEPPKQPKPVPKEKVAPVVVKTPTPPPSIVNSSLVPKEKVAPVKVPTPPPSIVTSPPVEDALPPPPPVERKKIIQVRPDSLLCGLTDALNWTQLEIGVATTVARNFVNNTGDFFVQGFQVNKEAISIAEEIEKHVKSGNALNIRNFAAKTICLAPFSGDFYRGEILGPSKEFPGQVDIFFSDFGNIEPVGTDVIFEIPPNLASMTRVISHCIWDMMLAKEFPEPKLKELFDDERLPVTPIMQIAPGQYLVQLGQYAANADFEVVPFDNAPTPDAPEVVPTSIPKPAAIIQPPKLSPPAVSVPEVTTSSSPGTPVGSSTTTGAVVQQSVAVTVSKNGVASPMPSVPAAAMRARPTISKSQTSETVTPPPRKKYMLKDLDYSAQLVDNAELQIGFTWGLTRYLMIGKDHDADGDKIQTLIAANQSKCEKLKPDEIPVIGEVLLAPYDGDYYRGVVKIMDLNAKTAFLEFIDFGDKATVEYDKLYVPNTDMMKIPILGLTVNLPQIDPIEGAVVSGTVDDYINEPMQLQLFEPNEPIVDDMEVALWVKNNLTLNAIVHQPT